MDLDKGLVVALVREGKDALSAVQAMGIAPETLFGEGRRAYQVLISYLEKHGAMPAQELVSHAAMVALDSTMPGAAVYFAEKILNRALTRQVEDAIIEISELSNADPRKAFDVLQRAASTIKLPTMVADLSVLSKPHDWDAYLTADPTGAAIPTPWKPLNDMLGGGLLPGVVTVLVSTTGAAKTQLALCISHHVAKTGTPAVYVGLETDRRELMARLLGIESDESWPAIYLRQLGHEKLKKLIEDHGSVIDGLPLYREHGAAMGWKVEKLEPILAAVRAKHPDKPIECCVDYLQLIAPEGKPGERRLEVGATMGTLKNLAEKYRAAILVISSTARASYKEIDSGTSKDAPKDAAKSRKTEPPGTGSPRRFLASGKESGEIEYTAGCLLVMQADDAQGAERRIHIGAVKRRAFIDPREWVTLLLSQGTHFANTDAPVSDAAEPHFSEPVPSDHGHGEAHPF